jgi:DnaJ-class molecular chaperone
MKIHNYYQILEIDPFVSQEAIKRAYFARLKEYHPDKKYGHNTFAHKRFQLVMEAYEAIKTPEKRAAYDERLKVQVSQEILRKNTKHTAKNDNRKEKSKKSIFALFKSFPSKRKA